MSLLIGFTCPSIQDSLKLLVTNINSSAAVINETVRVSISYISEAAELLSLPEFYDIKS